MENTVACSLDKDNTTPDVNLTDIWPRGQDSTPETRLLDLVGALILDLARTHPRIADAQIARWLAAVALGRRP
jgi:hypothetical protein